MIRNGVKPGFRFGIEWPQGNSYRRVLPFRRSWKVILLLVVVDGVFLLPAWAAFHQAAAHWSQYKDLFDLVLAVFTSAWLLGWSIAPVLISAVLVVLLLGREVVRARPRQVELFIGILRARRRAWRDGHHVPAQQDSGREQVENVEVYRSAHGDEAGRLLSRLQDVARRRENTFEALMEAGKVCSLGSVSHALFLAFR